MNDSEVGPHKNVHFCNAGVMPKMKQREFLSVTGAARGAAGIPTPVARKIRETCILGGAPLSFPQTQRNPLILHAVWKGDGFLLNLGHPDEEPRLPTWAELIEFFHLNLEDPAQREKFLKYFFCWSPFDGKPEPKINFSAEISGDMSVMVYDYPGFQQYMQPPAVAFRYLGKVCFCEINQNFSGEPLGELRFVAKNQSSLKLPHVLGKDLATLACLEYLFNKIGGNIQIEICK
jgi:hypothetical protein